MSILRDLVNWTQKIEELNGITNAITKIRRSKGARLE